MLAAHAYSGVAAKMSGVLRCICGIGDRDFSFCGSSVSSPDAAYRRLRGHADLGVRERIPAVAGAPGFALREASALGADVKEEAFSKERVAADLSRWGTGISPRRRGAATTIRDGHHDRES